MEGGGGVVWSKWLKNASSRMRWIKDRGSCEQAAFAMADVHETDLKKTQTQEGKTHGYPWGLWTFVHQYHRGLKGATVRTQLVRVIVSLLRRLSRLRGSALTGWDRWYCCGSSSHPKFKTMQKHNRIFRASVKKLTTWFVSTAVVGNINWRPLHWFILSISATDLLRPRKDYVEERWSDGL